MTVRGCCVDKTKPQILHRDRQLFGDTVEILVRKITVSQNPFEFIYLEDCWSNLQNIHLFRVISLLLRGGIWRCANNTIGESLNDHERRACQRHPMKFCAFVGKELSLHRPREGEE